MCREAELGAHAFIKNWVKGIKTAGRNINNLRYADDTTLMAESEEELKSLLTAEGPPWEGERLPVLPDCHGCRSVPTMVTTGDGESGFDSGEGA